MPFLICRTKEIFHSQVLELQKISKASDGYLNTELKKSEKEDSKAIGWLKWLVSLIPIIHWTHTSPLSVAREVAEFAERHKKFLNENDKQILIEVLENHKNKYQKYFEEKKGPINELIKKIQILVSKEISDLPQEMLAEILSKSLNSKDYETYSSVCWAWKEAIPRIAKQQEAIKFKKFLSFLVNRLQEEPVRYAEELKYLQERTATLSFSEFTSLSQLKSFLYCEKVKIKILLGFCWETEALDNQAKELELPWCFNGIFEPEPSQAQFLPFEQAKRKYFCDKVHMFLDKNLVDQALEISKVIKDKDLLFENLVESLIYCGQAEVAFGLLKEYSDDDEKLESAVTSFLFNNQIDKSILIYNRIKQQDYLKKSSSFLRDFSISLVKKGQFEEARKLGSAIRDEEHKDSALSAIGGVVAENGNLDLALEITHRISNQEKKNFPYSKISIAFAKMGRLKESFEIASKISCEGLRDDAYLYIAKELTKLNKFDEALEVTKLIEDLHSRNNQFYKIVSGLVEAMDFKKALKIIPLISEKDKYEYYDDALWVVSGGLAKVGRFKKAFEIANMIFSEEFKTSVFAKITKISEET